MREVVIVDSVRTGLAKSFRGKFNMTRPDDMAALRATTSVVTLLFCPKWVSTLPV